MNEKSGCIIWEQARVLGEARGVEIHGTCPVDAYCKGIQCVYLSKRNILSDVEKLADLRQELALLKLKNDLQN
ncbi:hypothetical protein M0R04_16070 [Candidatus Dojkabacteria bacterium]|jgi:hypothetical protein|nr:hypothetical protein [Candidatus Dojkabacteria bacterium]